jgi:hypothetical protein
MLLVKSAVLVDLAVSGGPGITAVLSFGPSIIAILFPTDSSNLRANSLWFGSILTNSRVLMSTVVPGGNVAVLPAIKSREIDSAKCLFKGFIQYDNHKILLFCFLFLCAFAISELEEGINTFLYINLLPILKYLVGP